MRSSARNLREFNELNFARFDAKLGERLTELRTELRAELTELRAELKIEFSERVRGLETRLVRWMLGFWISTLLGLGALFFRA
jgi:hypothetical protein